MITELRDGVQVTYLDADEPTPDEFIAWLVKPRRAIGFDVETGGVNPLDHFSPGFHVRLVALADERQAWVLHGDRKDDITSVFAEDRVFVAHNATFDTLAVKQTYGVSPRSIIDTFLLALMVYPPAGSAEDIFAVDIADDEDPAVLSSDGRHSLKPLSEMTGSRALVQAEETLLERFVEFVGPRPRGSEKAAEVREWMGRGYSTLDVGDPAYWVYNGLDAVFCLRVLRWLLAQWEGAPGDIRRLLDRESRLGQMLAGVTWRGLRVDRDALGKVFFAASTAQTEMLSSFGPYGVTNPDSAPQVAAALEELGVVDPVMSDAGQISTDKKAGLPRLRDPDQPDRVRELAELLVVWRGHKALRMKTREIDRISVASIDGRVHPKVNALKARTSRMSISDPALQNLPKNDPRIRAVFQAEDGHLLVGADFGQVEYRVAAALSRDPDLFEVIVSGEKLHNANARRVYGEGFTEKQYGQAKNGGFSVMYGAGPKRIAATFGDGTTLAQAQQFLESFRDAYPVLGDWIRSTQRHNEIVSLSGRRTAVDPDKRYANTNYHIQGAARDLFADALLRLRAAGWGDALWLVIHDEIILQVPEARAQDACAALEAAMTCTFRGVPITAEAKVLGTRWSEIPEVQADQQTTNRKAA